MNGAKTTLILGAGATRGAIKGYNTNGCRLNVPLNGDFISIARKFVRIPQKQTQKSKLDRLTGFIYDEIGWPKSKKTPTMEEIFSMAYTAKDFPEVYKSGRGRKPDSLREVQDFLDVLLAIFRAVDDYIVNNTNRDNLYRELVSLLEANDTIITLNYDTLLDRALLLRGWNPQKHYGEDFTRKLKGTAFRSCKEEPLRNVKLLKLHGSFNWFVKRSRDENLDIIFKKKPSQIFWPNDMRWNEKKGYVRQIIPPLYGKFFSHTFWEDLWTTAFKEIVSSDRLIVIGCSLVETDFHLRAFLGRVKVIKRNKNSRFKEVIIVDPDKEQRPQNNFKKVLRGCISRFKSMNSFESFIKQEKKGGKNGGS